MTLTVQTERFQPSFNSFYGKLELKRVDYPLKKKVSGWWKTFKYLDEDIKSSLDVGTLVDVYYSEKQNCYIIGRTEIRDCGFQKNVPVTFEAYIQPF